MIVDELIAILGYEVKGQDKLRKFSAGLTDVARKAAQVGAVMATAAAGAVVLGRSVIDTTAKFETFQATLETVEGSADKARQSLDWISDFAKKTPFEVEELTASFVKLRAYGMDPTTGLLEDLGNASSAMGKSLMDAVEMIADASTGEFERLKEFGIRASQAGDQVTFSWTENGKTLTRTVKKTGEEITDFLRNRFSDRFAGAMERQSKTFKGMTSNLSDSWTDFQRRIGEAGFFDAVKNQLDKLLQKIEELDKDGTLDRWAQNISNALEGALDTATFVFSRLERHLTSLSNWIDDNPEVLNKLTYALIALAAVTFPKTAALIALEDIITWMQGGESVIGSFADALEKLSGVDAEKIGAVLAVLTGATAGLAAVVGPLTLVSGAIKALAKSLGMLGGGAAGGGLAKLGKLGKLFGRGGAAGIAAYLGEKGISAGFDKLDDALDLDTSKRPDDSEFSTSAIFSRLYDDLFGAGGADVAPSGDTDAYLNWLENRQKMTASGAAMSTSQTLNDNSDKSVNVNVGGVTVNSTEAATGAVGAAVGSAVGQSAASAAKLPPTRYSTSGGF